MGFVSLTTSSNPCALFLPFLKTTLLSCSPMETCINYLQEKTWINSPLSLLLQHAEHKNETHPPQMKPQNIPSVSCIHLLYMAVELPLWHQDLAHSSC